MGKVERVARALAELEGRRPDKNVFFGPRLRDRGPLWRRYEREARRFVAMFGAIGE